MNQMTSNVHVLFEDRLSPFGAIQANPEPRSIAIVGLGYVGAVSSACFASIGHQVVGVDIDRSKVSDINAGTAPIIEEGLEGMIRSGLAEQRLIATTSIADATRASDVIMLCVGTPTKPDGEVYLGYLEAAASAIGEAIRDEDEYKVVVVRSTIAPGITRSLVIPAIEAASGKTAGEGFGICFHPEFLRESTAIADFFAPPKTVIGADDERAADILEGIYAGIPGPMLRVSIEAAEMVKYVDNTWHAVKVTFANEVGRICKARGIDSHEVMDVFVEDRKLNLSPYYMKPGFAFGGSCLPKDVRAINGLADRSGVNVPLMRSLSHSNQAQIGHALSLVEANGGRKVAFLGVTFKKDTDDLRESPTLVLMARLMDLGYDLTAFDPSLAISRNVASQAEYLAKAAPDLAPVLDRLEDVLTPDEESAMADADVIVVSHSTDAFRKAIAGRRENQQVIDLVRLSKELGEKGKYEGICW